MGGGKRNSNYGVHKFFQTRLCPVIKSGKRCQKKNCTYAHAQTEIKPSVNLDKTQMCRNENCTTENCKYAHDASEIRSTRDIYKSRSCAKDGPCQQPELCRQSHSPLELPYLNHAIASDLITVTESCVRHEDFDALFKAFQSRVDAECDRRGIEEAAIEDRELVGLDIIDLEAAPTAEASRTTDNPRDSTDSSSTRAPPDQENSSESPDSVTESVPGPQRSDFPGDLTAFLPAGVSEPPRLPGTACPLKDGPAGRGPTPFGAPPSEVCPMAPGQEPAFPAFPSFPHCMPPHLDAAHISPFPYMAMDPMSLNAFPFYPQMYYPIAPLHDSHATTYPTFGMPLSGTDGQFMEANMNPPSFCPPSAPATRMMGSEGL